MAGFGEGDHSVYSDRERGSHRKDLCMTRLYVGNIRYTADEASLKAIFEAFGPVQEVYIGLDRETGRSRGFAFVTMANPAGASSAITGLNGKVVDGRPLVVNEAAPRAPRGSGGDGRGGGGGDSRGGGPPPPRRNPGFGSGPPRDSDDRRDRGGGGRPLRSGPYDGPPEGRPPKGGKPGRDREGGKGRERDRFDRDDDWN